MIRTLESCMWFTAFLHTWCTNNVRRTMGWQPRAPRGSVIIGRSLCHVSQKRLTVLSTIWNLENPGSLLALGIFINSGLKRYTNNLNKLNENKKRLHRSSLFPLKGKIRLCFLQRRLCKRAALRKDGFPKSGFLKELETEMNVKHETMWSVPAPCPINYMSYLQRTKQMASSYMRKTQTHVTDEVVGDTFTPKGCAGERVFNVTKGRWF